MKIKIHNKSSARSGSVKNKQGFTLIELLVVISIIGLLSTVIFVGLANARSRSRDNRRLADMNQIAKAMQLYYNANFSYPTTTTSGSLSNNPGSPPLAPGYISKAPVTVLPADGSCATGSSNSANDYYMYANAVAGQNFTNTFVITFCLGNQTGAYVAGPHTLTQDGFQ